MKYNSQIHFGDKVLQCSDKNGSSAVIKMDFNQPIHTHKKEQLVPLD